MSKDKMSALSQREKQQSLDLEDILRVGARELVSRAVECEIDVYLEEMSSRRLHDGRAEIVRNGRHRERGVLYCGGKVSVAVPRTRNRRSVDENIRSVIIPRYRRRTLTLDEAIPYLYLKRVSTGDMLPTLEKLLGERASSLSASTVTRLKRRRERE